MLCQYYISIRRPDIYIFKKEIFNVLWIYTIRVRIFMESHHLYHDQTDLWNAHINY